MIIQSGRELYSKVSSLLGKQHGGGWSCPWCKELGVYEVEDETTSDRLFLSTKIEPDRHPLRLICRRAVKGLVDHHPVHSIEELFSEFSDMNIELAPGLSWVGITQEFLSVAGASAASTEIDPDKSFWEPIDILTLHSDPRTYEEWAKIGFSQTVVDKLHLGVTKRNRLSIPIPYLAPDGLGGLRLDGRYVQRTRALEGDEVTKRNPKYYWPSGLPYSIWYVPQSEPSQDIRPVIIVEGDTSTIAALEIWGDGPIATSTAGSNSWTDESSRYLLSLGHREFRIYYDNDDPGKHYAQLITQSLKTVAGDVEIKVQLVLWPEDAPDKYDPRAVLKDYGAERAKQLLEQWIVPNGWFSLLQPDKTAGRIHAIWDEEYAKSVYSEQYQQERSKLYDVKTLRGTDERPGLIYSEIKDFVETYKQKSINEEGVGSLFLIRSTPGVGKTRAAVRYAEEYALAYLKKREASIARALKRLYASEQTDDVKKKIEEYESGHYKKLAVLFIGPFIDGYEDILNHAQHPELWHNFKARSGENCQNYVLTQKIINAGYGVMKTACIEGGACPLRDQCLGRVNGELQYLAQLEDVKYHPIVYLRHNHLYMKDLMQQAKLIIVDEDPSSVALSSITVTLDELKKFDAYLMLEGEEASVVQRFVDSFIWAVESWPHRNVELMGRDLVRQMVVQSGDKTLHELAEYIVKYGLLDEIARWRPYEFDSVFSGTLISLITLLVRDVLRTEEYWNGQVFISDSSVIFYPMEPFVIDHKKPLIALDATGVEQKYALTFKRLIQGFNAEVFPVNARTYCVTNTESTMNVLLKGVTKRDEQVSLHGIRDHMTVARRSKTKDLSALNDIDQIVNASMRNAIKMALGLTVKHGQLLVVTYKTARLFMENFIQKSFPEYMDCMGFGHFRALRGLNVFESVPAVLVIGTPRVPPQVLKRDLIAFHKDDPNPLDLSVVRTDEYYHMTPYRYSTLMPADTRSTVADYLYELEAGEIQQVVGRIRAAVSDEEKYIYLMTARPAMTWMTYNGPGSEKWNQETYDPAQDINFVPMQAAHWLWYEGLQAAQYVDQYVTKHGYVPTIKELANDLGVSMSRAYKIRNYWKAEQDE